MRILHTADTHIGTRQYGLEERRQDFSSAFARVIEIAVEQNVDAVVHAGDLFEDRTPSAEDLHETFQTLYGLREAGIPFLGIVGNHERRRGVQWLDLFARLDLAIHLHADDVYELNGVRFVGLDYAGRRDVEIPDGDADVLVAHQLLDRVQPNGELPLEKLWVASFDYVLLGDWHQHEVWRERDTLVTYPGSTERWSLDERDQRGVNLIDLDSGRLDRQTLATRRFIYIHDDEDPIQGIDARRRQMDGAVVCVYLGSENVNAREIEDHARERGALAVRVRDRRPDEDDDEQAVHVDLDVGNLDALIADRLESMELSDAARNVDHVIRDLETVDSKVDAEVTKLLDGLTESDQSGTNN